MKTLAAGIVLMLAAITTSAVAQPPIPYPAVPELRTEIVPPPPGRRYAWEPGHWHWNGAGYVWVGGRYVVRGVHFGQDVPGHWRWAPRRAAWVWEPAHWR